MTSQEILNKFAAYCNYDPNQREFNLLSSNYTFHKAGKTIERLLAGYDPTGAIAVIYAKNVFQNVMANSKIRVLDVLENKNTLKDEIEMYNIFCNNDVKNLEQSFLDSIYSIYNKIVKGKQIGTSDFKAETVFDAMSDTIENLRKLHIDVFKKGGTPAKVTNISTKIQIFETMTECVLTIEKADDGLYLCFINANGTADCYFAFMYKSNGTIFALHDRVNETFLTQHATARNARWTEDKVDKIFPYDYIFSYAEHDYKGYATKYNIDDSKLEFCNLSEQVYVPLILTMLLIINRYDGYIPEKPIHYIGSLTPDAQALIQTTGLMTISKSEIAEINQNIDLSFDMQKILDGSYAKEFKNTAKQDEAWYENQGWYENETATFNNFNQILVDKYASDFVPDVKGIFNGTILSLTDKENHNYIPEFIGSEKRLRLQVHYQIRKQMAKHIKRKMEQEYKDFGGSKGVKDWYFQKLKENITFLQTLFAECETIAENANDNTYETTHYCTYKDNDNKEHELAFCIDKGQGQTPYPDLLINTYTTDNGFSFNRFDDITHKPANYWFLPKPKTGHDIAFLTHTPYEELPAFIQIFGDKHYNGNCLLDITDAVSDLISPCSDRSWGADSYHFQFAMGFAKSSWNQIKKTIKSKQMKGNKNHDDNNHSNSD